MKHFRQLLCALLVLAMSLGLLAGCGSTETASGGSSGKTETSDTAGTSSKDETSYTTEITDTKAGGGSDTWAVYMYICGSNLETNGKCATRNLLSLMNANRTQDTIFVAETGGASQWRNNFVDASKIQRWYYVEGDMNLVDEQPSANMGDASTLSSFLQFCTANYPADHTMLIIWDHGGGTLKGCCTDEIYGDRLSLSEMHEAFDAVWDLSADNPPIDILGFDCCLMATIDVADLFSDTASWLVASEETEPSLGWDYEALGETLAADPHISAHDLGVSICDSYYSRLAANDLADSATLSLTDLSRMPALVSAFNSYVDDIIVEACEDPTLFKELAIDAGLTENYGGNSRAEGYYDLVDLRSFAVNTSDRISSAQAVIKALDNAVEYSVNGEYRPSSGGLSFYYDYDGYAKKNKQYYKEGTIEGLKLLYTIGISGELTDDEAAYMEGLGLDSGSLPDILTFDDYSFGDIPVQLDANGTAYAVFGSEAYGCITDAMYDMYAEIDGKTYLIGTDDEVYADYTTGLVADQSLNNWGYLDGNLCYMELTYDCDDYNLYSVPVRIDGEDMFLEIAYDYDTNAWEVLGAREDGGETAMTSRLWYPDEGTQMTLLQYVVGSDGKATETEGAVITFHGDDTFEYLPLEDGRYAVIFLIEDLYTNTASSDAAWFTLTDSVRTYD